MTERTLDSESSLCASALLKFYWNSSESNRRMQYVQCHAVGFVKHFTYLGPYGVL